MVVESVEQGWSSSQLLRQGETPRELSDDKQAFFAATLGLPHQTFEGRTSAFAASIRSATLIASLYW